MLEVVTVKREANCLAVQPCLDSTTIRDTRGLENLSLSSSQWMLSVLAGVHCGPSGVQVPWPHLSIEGESRPLTISGRTLSYHHHPLQKSDPAQGLVPPLGG
jgi:hypothetical protein